MFLDAFAHRLHDAGVDADQIVAAHARLPGDAGGDDNDVCAADGAIVFRPGHRRIEPFDRRGFGDVQSLALRNPIHDVEKDDVAQLFQTGEQGERAADIPGADQRDLVTGHD